MKLATRAALGATLLALAAQSERITHFGKTPARISGATREIVMFSGLTPPLLEQL
jgi:hypothetical protein